MASEPDKKIVEGTADVERASEDAVSFGKGDLLQLEHTDPVLNAKMHLVNNVSSLRLKLYLQAHATLLASSNGISY